MVVFRGAEREACIFPHKEPVETDAIAMAK